LEKVFFIFFFMLPKKAAPRPLGRRMTCFVYGPTAVAARVSHSLAESITLSGMCRQLWKDITYVWRIREYAERPEFFFYEEGKNEKGVTGFSGYHGAFIIEFESIVGSTHHRQRYFQPTQDNCCCVP
jgi:hypothetical protein